MADCALRLVPASQITFVSAVPGLSASGGVMLGLPLNCTGCWLLSTLILWLTFHFYNAVVPATVVAAASFDDAIAITGYTIFINLAVTPKSGSGWQIAHGPLSLVLGLVAGVLAGIFSGCTKLWNNSFKRTSVLFVLGAEPPQRPFTKAWF